MNNLIKAEFYRLKCSVSPVIKLFIILLDLCAVATTLYGGGQVFTYQGAASQFPMTTMMISLFVASVIGGHFTKRTAHYEIMNGTGIHKCIWMRLIFYVSICFGAYFVPVAAVLLFFDHSLRCLMAVGILMMVFLRIMSFVILSVMVIKAGEGAVLSFVRLMLENIVAIMSMSDNEDQLIEMSSKIIAIFGWMPYLECTIISNGLMDSTLAVKAVIGAIAEFALLYFLAYTSYKKKWNIRTSLGTIV
ncbi:MAG: hypothetical protein IJ779_04250 [Ruminococcus sp.]|nr:hypothetical protein [Ruminococcus sp.]